MSKVPLYAVARKLRGNLCYAKSKLSDALHWCALPYHA